MEQITILNFVLMAIASIDSLVATNFYNAMKFSYIYVTRSDKTSLIARKYTHAYNGIYLLLCRCYSNSINFIELLRNFASYMVKLVLKYCVQKELLNFCNAMKFSYIYTQLYI